MKPQLYFCCVVVLIASLVNIDLVVKLVVGELVFRAAIVLKDNRGVQLVALGWAIFNLPVYQLAWSLA
jgi:hypothetical protein